MGYSEMLAKTPKPKDTTTSSHLVQISPQLLLFSLAKSSELSACVPEKPGYDGCLVCTVSVQCLDFKPPSRRLRGHLHYQNFPWNWFSAQSVSSVSRCHKPYHFHIVWEVTQPELPIGSFKQNALCSLGSAISFGGRGWGDVLTTSPSVGD